MKNNKRIINEMNWLKFSCLILFSCLPNSQSLTVSASTDLKLGPLEELRLFALKNLLLQLPDEEDEGSEIYDGIFQSTQDFNTLSLKSVGDVFIPNLNRAQCGAWDSCVLRCSDPILGAPYICSCDDDCFHYGDCCIDFTYYCGDPNKTGSVSKFNQLNKLHLLQQSESQLESELGLELSLRQEMFDENIVTFGTGKEDKEREADCEARENSPFSSYGFWRWKNGTRTKRMCLRKMPAWCDPTIGHFDWDFTQSLSILLNFGPDGWNNDLLFSSDYYDPQKCPNVWEIYDPFNQICRPIECNQDYVLEDGKCVWDGTSPKPPNNNTELLGYRTKMANITIYGNILLADSWSYLALPLMRRDFVDTLATKIRLNGSRFSNCSIEQGEHPSKIPQRQTTTTTLPIRMTTDYDNDNDDDDDETADYSTSTTESQLPGMEEDHLWVTTEKGFPVLINITLARKNSNSTHELTVEQFLSVIHEAVSLRAVLRTKSGVPMKINGVQKTLVKEEIDFFKKWCKGGDLESYWNEEFQAVFVLKNKTDGTNGTKLELAIKIKDTDKLYEEGHYVANLLYQSTDMSAESANVSGLVVVCENRPHITSNECPRLSLNFTEFTLNENGTLSYLGEIPGIGPLVNRSQYEFKENGDVTVCVNYDEAKQARDFPEPNVAEKIASLLTMSLVFLSLLGLLATIITYGLFKELRTLPGWCLIHLCFGEFVFFLLFVSGARRPTSEHDFSCVMIAISLHLSALLFFTWSSIISYDLYSTFTKFQAVVRSSKKYLWRYSLIGYGVPTLIVFTSVMVEFTTDVKINYGGTVCWISNSMASLWIFALPIAISILANGVFFLLTVLGIRRVAKITSASALRQRESARFSLYVRMSSIQCFSWIFGFLTVLTHFSDVLSTIFEFLFLILSSVQGLYIFFAFVCHARVYRLYKNWWADIFYGKTNKRTRRFGVSDHSSLSTRGTGIGSVKKSIDNEKELNTNNTIFTINDNIQIHDILNNKPGKTNNYMIRATNRKADLEGNQNILAQRTVSNETVVSFISNDSLLFDSTA